MSARSILLVEDNAGDVRLTREALREADVSIELTAVADGEQALAFLRGEGAGPGAPTSSCSTSTSRRRTGSRCSRRSGAIPSCAGPR